MISPAESQNVDLVESPGGWELPPVWRDTVYRVYRGKDTKLQLESIRVKASILQDSSQSLEGVIVFREPGRNRFCFLLNKKDVHWRKCIP